MVRRTFIVLAGLFMMNQAFANDALWMRYPAISPDGQTIVFSYQDDLYRVPVDGGTAVPVTRHTAYDYMPVWSPDGKSIAFASDRYGNFDVFIIPAEGGEARRLTYHSAGQVPNSFTPDGTHVLFSATMYDNPENVQFPSGLLSELYSVPVDGGRIKQVLSTPALAAKYNRDGNKILYHDVKGYENAWRKHHTSSVTRDVWMYDAESDKHKQLTSFEGEDREPWFCGSEDHVFYLSEQFGDFNVCRLTLDDPSEVVQITFHEKHPVRFLTRANNGTLCYGFNGKIYAKKREEAPSEVPITIFADGKKNAVQYTTLSDGITEMDASPDGKEVAFIVRGEVYVTSVEYATTKRITSTPEQERSVSFSPDGRSLLYASERDESWNLYRTKIVRDDEKHFANATLLEEDIVLDTPAEEFQPAFSPDGKEVAFLEERKVLRVINLESKKVRTILDGKYNYSYADGDQWYEWSPDGKWFLVHYLSDGRWEYEAGLIDAGGEGELINLTNSGYADYTPRWMMNGTMMIWASDREGMRSHGGWGSQDDIYGLYFTQDAFDKARLSKEEFELLKEKEDAEKEDEAEDDEDKKKKKDKKDDEEKKVEPIRIDLKNIEDRTMRLTINSSSIADALVTPDGEKLYYLSRFEKGYDLWVNKLRENETKLVIKLNGRRAALDMDKEGKTLFLMADGKLFKLDPDKSERKPIAFQAEFTLNDPGEKAYLFEHVWRQIKKKFYDPGLHGVDWDFYKAEYARFLPHINNNYDFAEMLSEMLGELNGSHTGSGHRPRPEGADATARLGAFFDESYAGNGLRIAEIFDKSPLLKAEAGIKEGIIVEKIDGQSIISEMNWYPLLNHKSGKPVLLSLFDPEANKRWDATVKPISRGRMNQLLYERWVKGRRKETERLSGGRLGYIHIRGMNPASYRATFKELFGRFTNKEAIVIDTRFNGGGNLVEELTTLLSGEQYLSQMPRGQYIGIKPQDRWTKPSIVIISESNYSDAHGFPYGYKTLGIGKLVGMPVPGTMTSVWWETLQDRTLYFGIPQVGKHDLKGEFLENQQLEPDYRVPNDYDQLVKGRDQQLEEAVRIMLEELDQ